MDRVIVSICVVELIIQYTLLFLEKKHLNEQNATRAVSHAKTVASTETKEEYRSGPS
jgi:hypothetical protein